MTETTIGALLEATRSRLDRLEPAAALREFERGALIVDTRCAEALASGVIPGSVHAPLSVLYRRLDPRRATTIRRSPTDRSV